MSETRFSTIASASLPVRFALYLPTAPHASQDEADELEAVVAEILCERFGGVTAYPAKGTFASASGSVQTEPITVLETYCEREAWRASAEGVASLA